MSATTPTTHGSRPPYRPALDGLRAIAVIGVLVFHLNPKWLPGGWLGVDLFFVLSGFLITTLILREQNRTGSINFPAFWMARMRRLLPALTTTLFAVIIASWFLTIDARRQSVAYDVLSALGYVANWRFILGDEGYFATLELPSPVRHTWSLSIEEQFYIAFPLLMGLLGWLTTKRIVHAFVLTALAAGSATLMFLLYVPNTDPVRVYFGTDTRAFELLIGAIGAIVFRSRAFTGFLKLTWLIQILAFLGLTLFVFAMFTISDNQPLPYQGGLVVLSLAAFAAILAAASSPDSIFSRIIGFAPFKWIGLISYPLYLWHWPVIIYFDTELTALRGIPLAVSQAVISVLLAWATYKFIEGPIRGRRLLVPQVPAVGKVVVVVAIPILIVTTFSFARSIQPFNEIVAIAGKAELGTFAVTASEHRKAMVLGNSVPDSLAKTVQVDAHPYLSLVSNTFYGCEPFAGNKIIDDIETLPTKECLDWRTHWPHIVAEQQPDVTVYFVPQTLVNDRIIDGERIVFGTPEFEEFLDRELTELRTQIIDSGSRTFALSNLACHELASFDNEELDRINDIEMVIDLNQLVQEWADEHRVPVIDTYTALCPGNQFSPTVNGIPLYSDGLHFTNDSGPIFWNWMAPQLVTYLESVN